MTKITCKTTKIVVPTKTGNCYTWCSLGRGESVTYNDHDIHDNIIKSFIKKFGNYLNIEKDAEIKLNTATPKKIVEVPVTPPPKSVPEVKEVEEVVDIPVDTTEDTVEDADDDVDNDVSVEAGLEDEE